MVVAPLARAHPQPLHHKGDADLSRRAAMFREGDDWKTWLVLNGLFQLPTSWTSALPRLLQCWLRNMLATYVLYFGAAFVWVYYAYW